MFDFWFPADRAYKISTSIGPLGPGISPFVKLIMHLSISPLPRGLTYFYRGFDSKYRPKDIDIFFQQPIIALQFNLSMILYFPARILKLSTVSD